jgi:DNA-binding CsgD family transcriptional regulator
LRADTAAGGGESGPLLAEGRELAGLSELNSVAESRAAAALGAIELAAGQPEWAQTLERAVELARLSDEFDVECAAAHALVVGHMLGGAPAEARRWAQELEQRCARRLLGAQQLQFTAQRLWLDLHERGACAEVIDACRTLLRDPAPDPVAGQLEGLMALALADTNELREARRVLERALERATSDRGRLLSWTLAEIELLSGEAARAATLARACLADGLAAHPVGALAAVTEAWATREHTEEGAGSPIPAFGGRSFGGSETELAGIAALVDQPAAAQGQFDSGASGWRGVQYRGELRCRWAAAESARRTGERAEALELLRRVGEAVQASGFTVLLARVKRSLRDAGVREATGRSADPRGLTAREREILEYVGQGMTSGAIARRLSLEPATIETHIESAREKLGATNRTQAAIMARG